MLLYIFLGLLFMVFLFLKLKRIEEIGVWIFNWFMGLTIVFAIVVVVSTEFNNTTTVYDMDTNTVYNEVYDGVDHYYAEVDGEEMTLPSDDSSAEFVRSDANEIIVECDGAPGWVIPWPITRCEWTIKAEHVE